MQKLYSCYNKLALVLLVLLVGTSIQQAQGGGSSQTTSYSFPSYSSRATLKKQYDTISTVTIGARLPDSNRVVIMVDMTFNATAPDLCLYIALGASATPGPNAWVGSDIIAVAIPAATKIQTSNIVDATGMMSQTPNTLAHITNYLTGTQTMEAQDWSLFRSDSSSLSYSTMGVEQVKTFRWEMVRSISRNKNDGANDVDYNKNGMPIQAHAFAAPQGGCPGYGIGSAAITAAPNWNIISGQIVADFGIIASAMIAFFAVIGTLFLN